MKIIVPMAGRGSRLRPHTLTVPKPLIPIAGKPIVHRLVRDIARLLPDEVEEVAYIIARDFGEEVEKKLMDIAESLGTQGTIYYQDEPLGTGHAVMCAKNSLTGPCVIAYADTLFTADFELDREADSIIWVKQVEDPSQYGVVQMDDNNHITGLVEKPEERVSDLAVVGIYYFKEAGALREELQKVMELELTRGGEYQINDGILAMMKKGKVFVPGEIDRWMDCGNKDVTVATNSEMLQLLGEKGEGLISPDLKEEKSGIIEPCYIGDEVVIRNSTVGPNVSLGKGCVVENSTISNSLVQNHSTIKNARLENAMIGNHVHFDGAYNTVSLGDYSVVG